MIAITTSSSISVNPFFRRSMPSPSLSDTKTRNNGPATNRSEKNPRVNRSSGKSPPQLVFRRVTGKGQNEEVRIPVWPGELPRMSELTTEWVNRHLTPPVPICQRGNRKKLVKTLNPVCGLAPQPRIVPERLGRPRTLRRHAARVAILASCAPESRERAPCGSRICPAAADSGTGGANASRGGGEKSAGIPVLRRQERGQHTRLDENAPVCKIPAHVRFSASSKADVCSPSKSVCLTRPHDRGRTASKGVHPP